jgi:hypothetical protein
LGDLAMGDPKELLQRFWKQWDRLRLDYDVFDGLFGQGNAQRHLLKEAAPDFFEAAKRMMRESLFLQFCRITDPAGSGKQQNLSTNTLLKIVLWPSDVRLRLEELNNQMMCFRKYVEPARNKRGAHTDLKSEVEQLTLGGFPPGSDKRFLGDLEEFLSIAHEHLGMPFSRSLPVADGARQLVRRLLKSRLYDSCASCSVDERVEALQRVERELG